VPVLLVVTMGASACLGGSGSAAPVTHPRVSPADRLAISVKLLPEPCSSGAIPPGCRDAKPQLHRYALTCGPTGGTMPNAAGACAAIADLVAQNGNAGGCPGVLRGPGSTATIAGTVSGRPFHLQLDGGYSWCGPPANVMRDYWILSTFPCSHTPLHMAGSHWAEATGCRPE